MEAADDIQFIVESMDHSSGSLPAPTVNLTDDVSDVKSLLFKITSADVKTVAYRMIYIQ